MNLDAPQPSPARNHTLLRIETLAVDDSPSGMDAFGSEAPEPTPATPDAPASSAAGDVRSWSAGSLVRALVALAVVEAFIIAGLLISRSNVFDTHAGRLVIESDPSGADVWLDGRHLGMTPLSMMSDAGERSLRIDADGASRTMKVGVANGQVTHARVDFVRVPAVASTEPIPSVAPTVPPAPAPLMPEPEVAPVPVRPATAERPVGPGWIDVPTVVALDVYEGGRHVGNTADGRLRLPAGPHALEFVNEELGVRVRTETLVVPGKVTPVILRQPDRREQRVQERVAADTPAPVSAELTE